MKRTVAVCCVVFGLISGQVLAKDPPYDQAAAEAYIRAGEKAWAESVASGDTTAVKRLLAEDFVGVDPEGSQYDKAQMVHDTALGPKTFASNHLNDIKLRFYGTTAIAQGSESWVKKSGAKGRFVWTDTWLLRDGKWEIAAAEDLIAPEPGNAKP
ncbi:nuclear transport factor 2 family protein [Bacillus sp. NP157]|nr:nuclear transport factor 2 family protein [Bacillus sp. NP157]